MQGIEVATGTAIGRDHRIKGENGQDALVCFESDNSVVAVVADGCGSGKWSELGSRFGAHSSAILLQRSVADFEAAHSHSQLREVVASIEQRLVEQITQTINSMGGRKSIIVSEYFLFTIVAMIISRSWLTIVSFGDGAYGYNGSTVSLGPFPDNAPPYIGYKISGSSLDHCQPELLSFSVCARVPLVEVGSCFIGTDGVLDFVNAANRKVPGKEDLLGPLDQFWTDDGYFRNPDKIRRKLFLANKDSYRAVSNATGKPQLIHESGLLPDDTTIVVARSVTPCATEEE